VTVSGPGQRFRPEDRVRRKADFDEAYARGRRISSRLFTLIACASGHGRPRLGVTISKKVGRAVVRNAVRRRIREVFRRNRNAFVSDIDIIIHVRPAASQASFKALEGEFLEALRRYGAAVSRRG